MSTYLLAIDQGTTSSRAILFTKNGAIASTGQYEFTQHYPQDGWVEHEPEDIWQTTVQACKDAMQAVKAGAEDIISIGITNQRETTLVWNKTTGKAVYPAIVWQDRRTAALCDQLKAQGHEAQVTEKTGLLLDPYFSGTKIRWILDNVDGAREQANNGELLFGTVDSYLLWRLSGGKSHKTDATNASRTLLFNIKTQVWDEALLKLLDIPSTMLPEVMDCAADFGSTEPSLFGGSIPIGGIAGDQQAALIGQACFTPGAMKSTYGTGCFLIVNTGSQCVSSSNRLLSTVAYRINGETTYGIEGSIFIAGAAVQWLRDGLKLVEKASDTQALAASVDYDHGVYLVPAFTGLGAPHWDAEARGGLLGLTRDSGIAEIVSATLQSVAYQTKDLISAIEDDSQTQIRELKVDGGMVANDWLGQCLADIMNCKVIRPEIIETTALGAAYLAGLQAGVFSSLENIASLWQQQASFEACISPEERQKLHQGWQHALKQVKLKAES